LSTEPNEFQDWQGWAKFNLSDSRFWFCAYGVLSFLHLDALTVKVKENRRDILCISCSRGTADCLSPVWVADHLAERSFCQVNPSCQLPKLKRYCPRKTRKFAKKRTNRFKFSRLSACFAGK
jgi:hypothetical protein